MEEVTKFFQDYPYPERIIYASSPEEALVEAEALVINTEWNVFRQFDISRIKALMANPVVFDGRNIFDPVAMAQQDLVYHYIGKPLDQGANRMINGETPSFLTMVPQKLATKNS